MNHTTITKFTVKPASGTSAPMVVRNSGISFVSVSQLPDFFLGFFGYETSGVNLLAQIKNIGQQDIDLVGGSVSTSEAGNIASTAK